MAGITLRSGAISAARAAVLLLLCAAIFDLPLPAASRARIRVHLIDRSDSVRAKGPPGSLTPEDADDIAAWDRDAREPGDTIIRASFGADVAFESDAVDAGDTDLQGAIEAALARNPTEIVLHSDGRADPGGAPLLCRARGVPIHVFPIGPTSVRDARIARISAPADATEGQESEVDVTVESTYAGRFRLSLDGRSAELDAAPGAPAVQTFRIRAPARFRVLLEPEDACPRNNEASGEILVRTDRRRVLVLSEHPIQLPGVETTTSLRLPPPEPYDAVILNDVPIRPDEMRALAAYARDFGGGVLIMGGERSYAMGGWKETPLDEISPLRAAPDERVAVVFAVDSSGSMDPPGKLDAVLDAVRSCLHFFERGDEVVAMAFSEGVEFVDVRNLRRIRAGGGTHIARGLEEARRHLLQSRAGRKHVFVLTDGEVAPDEKPEMRQAAAERLREAGIGLTVVTTIREIEVGQQVKIGDWKALEAELIRLLHAFRGDFREDPGMLEIKAHPVMSGIAPVEITWMNRTSLRDRARLAATAGTPPASDPAVAFMETGRGRVGAFAFPYDPRLERLYAQSIEHVTAAGAEGLALWVDPPLVRANGRGPAEFDAAWRAVPSGRAGAVRLRQVGPETWEGTLPPLPPGTVFVRAGRARAAASIPCAREDELLGIDLKALERIAGETGGKMLRSSADLRALPRPSAPGRKRGRPVFLAAAAALFLAELALSTFWKP